MKKIFVTFGDGSDDLKNAAIRLRNEALSSGFFDDVIMGNLAYLKENCSLDYLANINFIKNNTRGLGYWIWKPIILRHVLDKVNYGDLIFYSDAGCELSTKARSHFKFLCKLAKKNEGLFFRLPHLENAYTKADIFNDDIFKGQLNGEDNQVQATFFLLHKTIKNIHLIDDWYSLAVKNNYHYIDDSPSELSNHISFIENRHDQSILSCLIKLNNHYIFPHNYWFPRDFYFKKSPLFKYFIHQLRSKTGESLLENLQTKQDKNWLKKSVFIYSMMFKLDLKIFLTNFIIGRKILGGYRLIKKSFN
jgi:hypothetical protein